jgi:hypothetical protein
MHVVIVTLEIAARFIAYQLAGQEGENAPHAP